jgi:hypothetical protein
MVQISERYARLSSLVVENEPNASELREIVLCRLNVSDPPFMPLPPAGHPLSPQTFH